ncbi:PucR family transcriptional regulator [Streptosporangium sp. CA-115845]|uniref:PucR family transcriptional regulator n=1 Tax=Streptosporangium sp. CA-115845 TaxID=3240071 RepID=UPI003D937083
MSESVDPGMGGLDPRVRQILDAVEASLPQVTEAAVDEIWRQVPGYATSPDPGLRGEVAAHVDAIFRLLPVTVAEHRPARPSDFPVTVENAAHRVRQGVSLSDFLQAFRLSQLILWEGMLEIVRDDAAAREAVLSLVGKLMQVIEVGSSVAAEAYVEAQHLQLAERDRVRRDLLEDLLARRDVSPGSKRAMLRSVGLDPAARLVVASAVPVRPLTGDQTMHGAVADVRRAIGGRHLGLVVVRQEEVVAVSPMPTTGLWSLVTGLREAVDQLARQSLELAVGISTVHRGLAKVPEAYTEACVARDGLDGGTGVLALPMLSSFDYLMLRDDEIARRLIRAPLRRFVEDDRARGGALITTLMEYIACDLNAKIAAQRLHLHVNTAYYRLERIAERTGCDLRSLADIQELQIAVRLLGGRRRPPAPPSGT